MEAVDWKWIAEREVARPIACEILSTCASTRGEGFLGIAISLDHTSDSTAAELAREAWDTCAEVLEWKVGVSNPDLYYTICVEAESLLQCGWFPGEPPELY